MTCSTCGRENPPHLTFCQECGQRLGPRIAPPTPPIGLGPAEAPPRVATSLGMTQVDPAPAPAPARAPAAAAGREKRCTICDTINPPNLRYCTSCGSNLDPAAVTGAMPERAPAAAPPPPAVAPPVAPAIAPARVVDLAQGTSAHAQGVRTCTRCRGVVDPGAQFCKFCGAPLADSGAHARARFNGSAPPPAHARDSAPQPAAAAQQIAPPTPFAPFAPAGVGPIPSASPIGGDAPSRSAAYGPPPAQPVAPSASPPAASPYGAPPAVPVPIVAPLPAPAGPPPPPPPVPTPAARAPEPKPAPPVGATPTRGRVVVVAKSGADGPSYPFGDTLDIGRSEGNVVVADDPYLSPRHVRIAYAAGRIILRDLGSTNGVYVRLAASRDMSKGRGTSGEVAVPLEDHDLILVGQQVLSFEILRDADNGLGTASEHGTLLFGSPAAKRYARLGQRTVEGVTRDVYYLRKMETVLGRESGDVVFTEDPFLSRRHAAIRALGRDGSVLDPSSKPSTSEIARFALVDLGSSNGTFLRIRNEIELVAGDQFRVGQQLFRVDIPGSPSPREA